MEEAFAAVAADRFGAGGAGRGSGEGKMRRDEARRGEDGRGRAGEGRAEKEGTGTGMGDVRRTPFVAGVAFADGVGEVGNDFFLGDDVFVARGEDLPDI